MAAMLSAVLSCAGDGKSSQPFSDCLNGQVEGSRSQFGSVRARCDRVPDDCLTGAASRSWYYAIRD